MIQIKWNKTNEARTIDEEAKDFQAKKNISNELKNNNNKKSQIKKLEKLNRVEDRATQNEKTGSVFVFD